MDPFPILTGVPASPSSLPRARLLRRAAFAAILTLYSGSGWSDSTGVLRITPESVIRYLHQDLFISPGVGFDKVRIGYTFQQVELAWGNPNKTYDSDVGSKTAWVYEIGRDSEIAVSGGTRVTSIEILGSFNSPFSTTQGANFGMTPHQVIGIYGKPSGTEDLARLRYPEKGITFNFKSGALQRIKIYSPG